MNGESTAYNGESIAYNAGTIAYNGESTGIMPKAPPCNAKSTQQLLLDHFKPAMAFHKRRPKMKYDHIACLPYA
jgi:hypothetical protein